MRDLLLTGGDLVISDHTLGFVSGVDRVKQSMLIRLQIFLGEWFLDVNWGVPYFQNIFVKNPDLDSIDAVLKSIILEDVEVQSIAKYNSIYNNTQRIFSLSFEAATTFGNVQVNL